MSEPLKIKLIIVTVVGVNGEAVLEDRRIDNLLEVLFRRANRLVADLATCKKLKSALREFVLNVVDYFSGTGEMDEYVMTNIMTALVTADNLGAGNQGVEDYSTLIRRLDPNDLDSENYFVFGRAGRINDPGCPLNEMSDDRWSLNIPSEQLHMFHAF